MFRTILVLGRMSNLPTVWTNVLAGWFIAGGMWEWELAWLIAGVSLLYVAGMTLNDAFDAGWDREHAPERPIPSGAISRKAVWFLGLGQLVAGIVVVSVFTGTSLVWLGALVAAILLYDWIHKKTASAVVVMGICRGLVVLLAGSAAAVALPSEAWWWAGGLSVYVAGITLVARGERTGGAFRTIAYVLLAAPVVSEMAVMGRPAATLFFYAVLVFGLRPKSYQNGNLDLGKFIPKLIAFICIFDAAMISELSAVLVCGMCCVMTLVAQRFIPGT